MEDTMTKKAKELGDEPAFPAVIVVVGGEAEITRRETPICLTKRELFAAMALQGLCAKSAPVDKVWEKPFVQWVRKMAIESADALLEELSHD